MTNLLHISSLPLYFPRYLFKGKNSLGSTHVKQTPHNPNMMWASNTYLIVFQGRWDLVISVENIVQDGRHEDNDPDRRRAQDQGGCMIKAFLDVTIYTYLVTQFNIRI